MKLMKIVFTVLAVNFVASSYAGNVCHLNGKLGSITPSFTDVGVHVLTGERGGCTCESSQTDKTLTWIDIDTEGGKAMYSGALAAKMAGKQVTVTIIDDLGQGSAGNESISMRWWASCQVVAIEIHD